MAEVLTETDEGEQMETEKVDMNFEYCPSCAVELDTGWECNSCGRDWRAWATLNSNVSEPEVEQ